MKYLLCCMALLTSLLAAGAHARAESEPFTEIPTPHPLVPPPLNTQDLARFFAERQSNNLLRVSMDTGQTAQGRFIAVRNDSLFLAGEDAATPEMVGLFLLEILRVDEQRSGSGHGLTWGALSGAVLGGGLGCLSGLYLTGMDGESNTTRDVIGVGVGTLGGMALGALALGTTGALLGSVAKAWYQVYPSSAPAVKDDPTPVTPVNPVGTRCGLMIGHASVFADDYDSNSLGSSAALTRRLGVFDLGPEIGFYELSGTKLEETALGGVSTLSRGNVLQFGFTGVWQRKSLGFAPYAALGTGFYIWSDAFLGGSVGGGLRWRSAGQHDIFLDGRYHFSILGNDDGSPEGFLTLGAGWAFGL